MSRKICWMNEPAASIKTGHAKNLLTEPPSPVKLLCIVKWKEVVRHRRGPVALCPENLQSLVKKNKEVVRQRLEPNTCWRQCDQGQGNHVAKKPV